MSVKIRIKELAKGRKSYYLDIYQNGQRHYETLGIYTSKADTAADKKEKKLIVDRIRAEREIELTGSQYGYTPKNKSKVNFIDYFKLFLDNYTGQDHRLVRYSLEKFIVFQDKTNKAKGYGNLKGLEKLEYLISKSNKIPCSRITTKICQEFAKHLTHGAGLKGESPYNYFSKFKKVIKIATRDGYFQSNPCEDISVKRIKGQLKKNILTAEELKLLYNTDCGNAETKRAFLFSCFTGLGAAEMRQIKWSNIKNGKLDIKRAKTGIQILNELPETAKEVLGIRGKANEYLFTLPSDTAINKALKVWVKNAGIDKHVTFYSGRHTFAVLLLKNGTNLKTIADAMGQTSTKETIKYLNYIDEEKSKALKSLPTL